mmetsp:Transcript_8954/g.19147  ORF Transcript_8954/g.19147 Transcript_8954/m.19147 type:complete len:113 (-) Transcript_8954:339-677(-)
MAPTVVDTREFHDLDDFYPFYQGEHRKTGTRVLHFVGTSAFLAHTSYCVATGKWLQLPLGFVMAYGCAWTGHFFIEGNKPATFKYPWLSAQADWRMYVNILTGKEGFVLDKK